MKNLVYSREAELRKIVGIYNLNDSNPYFLLDEKLFEFIYEHSKKPYYHNWEHILFVVIESTKNPLFNLLSHKDKLELIIAALFHDAGHFGNKEVRDIENINKAITLLKEYYNKEDADNKLKSIIEIIQSTENSYKIYPINSTSKKIIHDSDLLCTSYEDRLYFMKNLSLELKIEVNIKIVKEFLRNQTFYTKRGQDKQKELLEEVD